VTSIRLHRPILSKQSLYRGRIQPIATISITYKVVQKQYHLSTELSLIRVLNHADQSGF